MGEEASKDSLEEVKLHKQNLKKYLEHTMDCLDNAAESHEKYMKFTGHLAGVKITEDGYSIKVQKTSDELNDKKLATNQFDADFVQCTFQFNKAKTELKHFKTEAERIAPFEGPNGAALKE